MTLGFAVSVVALLGGLMVTQSAGAQEQAGGSQYVVQSGDTLFSIANRFDTTVSELAELNDIENVNRIFVGQVLQLPNGNDNGNDDENDRTIYTVQSGDTLFSIANRFGTTVGALAQTNHIVDVNVIHVGQQLVIPGVGNGNGNDKTTYTVQQGDWLSAIARQFGVTVPALVEANDIANPNVIHAGQVLVIPD